MSHWHLKAVTNYAFECYLSPTQPLRSFLVGEKKGLHWVPLLIAHHPSIRDPRMCWLPLLSTRNTHNNKFWIESKRWVEDDYSNWSFAFSQKNFDSTTVIAKAFELKNSILVHIITKLVDFKVNVLILDMFTLHWGCNKCKHFFGPKIRLFAFLPSDSISLGWQTAQE